MLLLLSLIPSINCVCNLPRILIPNWTSIPLLASASPSDLYPILSQYVQTQPDTSSSSGFFKYGLAYLIPLVFICAVVLGLLILAICVKAKRLTKPIIKLQDQGSQRMCQQFYILALILVGIGLTIIGILNVLATFSAVEQVNYLQCVAMQGVNGFHEGDGTSWIGVDNLETNASGLRLGFVNNIRQMKSGLQGFTTNLSQLGIPINAVWTTMKANLQANFTKWLFYNTSVSAIQVPVCRTINYTVPNPIDNTKTVTFPTMSQICTDLTAQANNLVTNAQNLDYLLANYTALIANMTNINTSLVSLSNNFKTYQSALSSYQSSVSLPYISSFGPTVTLSYIVSGIAMALGLITIILSCLAITNKHLNTGQILLYILGGLILVIVFTSSAVCIYFLVEAISFGSMSLLYENLSQTDVYNNITSIYNISHTISDPISACLKAPTSRFLSFDTTTLQIFPLLSNLYIASTPPFILDSLAVKYTNLTNLYLSDLSKIPLNDSALNLSTILGNINLLANYNLTNSTQLPCQGSTDQFYFNPLNCTYDILDPSNATEITIRQPRCIQLPTNERNSGSNRTSLNSVQTLYNISTAPCNSNYNMFTNPSCFFSVRESILFASSDCSAKGSSLASSITNLVGFSVAAGEAWDTFEQNLRNYLGILLIYNTNITAFYTNDNITQMFGAFSTPASNLISNSSCLYVQTTLDKVNTQLKSTGNSLVSVVVLAFSISAGSLLLLVVLMIGKCCEQRSVDNRVSNMNPLSLGVENMDMNITNQEIRDEVLMFDDERLESGRKADSNRSKRKSKFKEVSRVDTLEDVRNVQDNQKPLQPLEFSQEVRAEKQETLEKVEERVEEKVEERVEEKVEGANTSQIGRPYLQIDVKQRDSRKPPKTAREYLSSSTKNISSLILNGLAKKQQSVQEDKVIMEGLVSGQFQNKEQKEESWVSDNLSGKSPK